MIVAPAGPAGSGPLLPRTSVDTGFPSFTIHGTHPTFEEQEGPGTRRGRGISLTSFYDP
jgi:hypothetical protein